MSSNGKPYLSDSKTGKKIQFLIPKSTVANYYKVDDPDASSFTIPLKIGADNLEALKKNFFDAASEEIKQKTKKNQIHNGLGTAYTDRNGVEHAADIMKLKIWASVDGKAGGCKVYKCKNGDKLSTDFETIHPSQIDAGDELIAICFPYGYNNKSTGLFNSGIMVWVQKGDDVSQAPLPNTTM